MAMIEIKRTFHPIGQGAFYTEVFQGEGDKPSFVFVYDCGTETADTHMSKPLSQQIDEWLLDDNIQQIDLLYISHFHKDHINGLDHLLNKVRVMKTIIPMLPENVVSLTRIHNLVTDGGFDPKLDGIIEELYYGTNDKESRFGKVVAVRPDEGERVKGGNDEEKLLPLNQGIANGTEQQFVEIYWIFKPYNSVLPSDPLAMKIMTNIKSRLPQVVRADGSLDVQIIMNDSFFRAELMKEYRKEFKGRGDNLYTLVVESKPADGVNVRPCDKGARCLYMGDFDTSGDKTRLGRLFNTYRDYADIGVVQVPHHGAKGNWKPEMLQGCPRLYVVSAGSNNSYHHPSYWVLHEIWQNGGRSHVVYEDLGSEIRLEYVIG